MQRTQSTAVHFVCLQKKPASASILLMTLHNSRRTAEERKRLELRHRFWILIPSQNMDRVIHFGKFKGAKKKPFPDIRRPYGAISGSSITCQNVGKISRYHEKKSILLQQTSPYNCKCWQVSVTRRIITQNIAKPPTEDTVS